MNYEARNVVAVAIVLLVALGAFAGEGSREQLDVLDRWEKVAGTASREDVLLFARSIEDGRDPCHRTVIVRLMGIAASCEANDLSRRFALELACAKTDATAAADVFHVLDGWVKDIYPLSSQDLKKLLSYEQEKRMELLQRFVRCCAEDLMAVTPDRVGLVRLLARMGLDDTDWSARRRYRLISQSNISPVVRGEIVTGMIAESPSSYVPANLLDALTSGDLAELLGLVRSATDSSTIHFSAAWALAHHGDKQVSDKLKQLQREPSVGAAEVHAITRMIRRIEIQNPPDQLLSVIANMDAHLVEGPRWFIARASALLPQDSVRTAILEYLEKHRGKKAATPYVEAVVSEAIARGIVTDEEVAGMNLGLRDRTEAAGNGAGVGH